MYWVPAEIGRLLRNYNEKDPAFLKIVSGSITILNGCISSGMATAVSDGLFFSGDVLKKRNPVYYWGVA
jgi:hypothetical protein